MNTDRFQFRVFSLDTVNGYIYCSIFNDLLLNGTETIQQCIGVKDENNRLIYEGDVVVWKCDNCIKPVIGEVRYILDGFSMYQIQTGSYYRYSEQELEELRKDRFEEDLFQYLKENNISKLCFYDYYGCNEFLYNQLEVIGSIADKYLLNKDGEVIKELEETDKTNLLQLFKYE